MAIENSSSAWIDLYVNQFVIIKGYASGINFGILKGYDPSVRHALLEGSRTLWSWNKEFTLNAVAMDGILEGRVSVSIPEDLITDVLRIIKCSEVATKILSSFPTHVPGK